MLPAVEDHPRDLQDKKNGIRFVSISCLLPLVSSVLSGKLSSLTHLVSDVPLASGQITESLDSDSPIEGNHGEFADHIENELARNDKKCQEIVPDPQKVQGLYRE